MKHLNFKTFTIALALLTGASAVASPTDKFDINGKSLLSRLLQKTHHGRTLKGQHDLRLDQFDLNSGERSVFPKSAVQDPSHSFTNLPVFNYLEGPDGATWYYTADYDIEEIVHNEIWTESLIKGFTFTIYDGSFNEVGKIHDVLRFAENETGRDVECTLDPAVSARFFNDDDNFEVMVYHAMNTVDYINHYYYSVYSIGGEKDEDGNDVCIATIEGHCIETVNVPSESGDENFYYTFVQDPVVEKGMNDFKNHDEYVEYLNSLTFDLITYKKGMNEVISKGIYATRIPGDTTDGIYFMSKSAGDRVYFIYSQYEKPFFEDPTGGAVNESVTPDNNLLIEQYAVSGATPQLVSTTKIPVEIIEDENSLVYSFYSIGSVAWTDDIDMIVNGTPDAPAYIVTRSVADAATLEDVISTYDLYDNSGKFIHNIATNTEYFRVLGYSDDGQPEIMFVKPTENESYTFVFSKLYSGEKLFEIDQNNNGDPLKTSCVRVLGKDGKYEYAFEMFYYGADGEQNDYERIAWFDNKGVIKRVDNVKLGHDVQASQIYMTPEVLDPKLFDGDDEMEYAVLVKRTYGNTIRNEFVIVDDNGGQYATFSADDGRGEPYLFTVLTGTTNRIMMTYVDGESLNVDLYDLPFLEKSVDSVSDILDNDSANISYDGSKIIAEGSVIEIYTPAGILVSKGIEAVSTEAFGMGVYVVSIIDNVGKKLTFKIIR